MIQPPRAPAARAAMRLSALVLSIAALLFAPNPDRVLADVVDVEPASCPNGGVPSTCHGGPHCRLVECTTNADCSGGATCQPVSACVGVVNCAGGLPPDADIRAYDTPTVTGSCEATPDCPSGDECRTVSMCVMAGVSPGSSGGCGCAVAGPKTALPPATAPLALVALALVAAVSVRPRRRPRR